MLTKFPLCSEAARWVAANNYPKCRVFAYGVEFDGTVEPMSVQNMIFEWTRRMEEKNRKQVRTEVWVEVLQ